MHIKTGMKIRNFGLSEKKIIEKGKRKRIEPIYLRYIETMKQENEGKEFAEIDEETLKSWDEEFGYSYQGLYTNDVLDMLLTEVQNEEFIVDFFGTDVEEDGKRKASDILAIEMQNENVYYWYNGRNQIFEKITREELLKSDIKCHSTKEDKEDISLFVNYLEGRFNQEKTEGVEK